MNVANQMKYQLADKTKVAKENLERMILTRESLLVPLTVV